MATDIVKTEFIDEIADVTNLQYPDETFDLVLCNQVLEHVFDFKKAVNEIKRVTKEGGLMMISTPFLYPIQINPMTSGGLLNSR